MKKVVVLSTGGTIASTPGSDGRNVSGAMPGEELVRKLQLGSEVDLEVHSVFQKPSNALTFDDLMQLRETCIAFGQRQDVDGIVITHGTDTMEDTAYFLESTLELPDVTIVVTGSQRVPHAMGTDAYINLRNAIHVAMSTTVRGLGVLVVFNESIYSAYTVRKISSFQVNGFDAPGHGCLGWVDNDVVKLFQMPMRQTLIQPAAQLPRVDIMSVSLGASAEAVRAVVESGPSGLVLEGLGRGHIPPDWVPVVNQALAKGITVLICSSGLSGGVYQSYEFPGSLFDAEQRGAIAVGDLTARKIRLRLMLLLGTGTKDRASIQAAFARTRSR